MTAVPPTAEGDRTLRSYVVVTGHGARTWQATGYQHALEQHADGFPDEPVLSISLGGAIGHAILPAELLAHLVTENGALGITYREEHDEWLVGYEFGREAEDSPMRAGAAYATAEILSEAIADVVGQLSLAVEERFNAT